jgi:hypothetical protein
MTRSSGALAFLQRYLEGLVLAEVDEIVGSRVGLGHFGEVGEQRLDAGEGDASEIGFR